MTEPQFPTSVLPPSLAATVSILSAVNICHGPRPLVLMISYILPFASCLSLTNTLVFPPITDLFLFLQPSYKTFPHVISGVRTFVCWSLLSLTDLVAYHCLCTVNEISHTI